MKKIGGYKTQTVVVMTLVLSCQLLTGTGLFCTIPFPHASRAQAKAPKVFAVTAVGLGDDVAGAWNDAGSRKGAVPCSCKKQKKCPGIPRVALTANPAHRLAADQRELGSQVCDSFVLGATDHRFALRYAPPYLELAGRAPSNSCTPLSITCVLLI